jgi:hypothetical protein
MYWNVAHVHGFSFAALLPPYTATDIPTKWTAEKESFTPKILNTRIPLRRPHTSYDGQTRLRTINLVQCGDTQIVRYSRATYNSTAPAQKRTSRTILDAHCPSSSTSGVYSVCVASHGSHAAPVRLRVSIGLREFRGWFPSCWSTHSNKPLEQSSTSKRRFGDALEPN